jgi:hypothetical protein
VTFQLLYPILSTFIDLNKKTLIFLVNSIRRYIMMNNCRNYLKIIIRDITILIICLSALKHVINNFKGVL